MSFEHFDNQIEKFLQAVADVACAPSEVKDAAKEILNMIAMDNMHVVTNRTYWFVWNNGSISVGRGASAEDAFTKLGYGGGALAAVDYYANPDYGVNAIKYLASAIGATPEKECEAKKLITEFYLKEIDDYLANLSDVDPALMHGLQRLSRAINEFKHSIVTKHRADDIKPFEELYAKLLKGIEV